VALANSEKAFGHRKDRADLIRFERWNRGGMPVQGDELEEMSKCQKAADALRE
jgi:hypothetical protein